MRTADPLKEAWEAWLYTEGKRTGQTQARQHRAGSKAGSKVDTVVREEKLPIKEDT